MYPTISPAAAKTAAFMHHGDIRATVHGARLAGQAHGTPSVGGAGPITRHHRSLRPAYATLCVAVALGVALTFVAFLTGGSPSAAASLTGAAPSSVQSRVTHWRTASDDAQLAAVASQICAPQQAGESITVDPDTSLTARKATFARQRLLNP